MSKIASRYYPPRAKWYSPLVRLGSAVRRRTHLDRLQLHAGISLGALLKSVWWPGIGFYVRGEKVIGTLVICGSLLLAAIFIVWLGYPAANVAFGLLLSAHVTSLVFLCGPWLAGVRFRVRAGFTLAVLFTVGLFVYAPLRNLLQADCLMPVRTKERVVVVQRMVSANSIQRGDWIAYTLPADRGVTGVRIQEGLGLGPVLAAEGDHIRFLTNGFAINGVRRAPLPHMPENGELVVPENHWFVWPDLAINGYGNAGEGLISATMLQLAIISESEFIGKPFKRWFWRRQLFP
jgi:hypothetical protein